RLEAAGDAETRLAEGRLTVIAKGPDPMLLLPTLQAMAPPTALHLVAEMSAPAATEARLYWTTPQHPDYAEANSMGVPLGPGRQPLLLPTPAAAITGRLRFDPGSEPGEYLLHSLEVRARSRGRAIASADFRPDAVAGPKLAP